MKSSEEFIQILEEVSDKTWDVPAKDIELSGWTESPKLDDLRKGLSTQSNDRNIKIPYLEKKSRKSVKSSSNKVRIPMSYTYNNYNNTSTARKPVKNSQNFLALIRTHPKPKIDNAHNSIELKKNFHITTIPLHRPQTHWRNKSDAADKRTLRLENYCNRDYVIITKAPPIVSGYSVTFYHK